MPRPRKTKFPGRKRRQMPGVCPGRMFKLRFDWYKMLRDGSRNFVGYVINTVGLRSAHTMGLVPATSPCDWSLRLVASCALAIFASKSSRRGQLWSLRLNPRIQTSLNFWDKSLRLVLQNASCELFVGQVPAASPFV